MADADGVAAAATGPTVRAAVSVLLLLPPVMADTPALEDGELVAPGAADGVGDGEGDGLAAAAAAGAHLEALEPDPAPNA